ncbi:MAG: proline--tRNA ligase [Spirochaetales bacterium]|uniref:Proline--tRNA ligase n=1 Tax=Candidatus Thalassospirochaeta sargassi TaxID=3119039 RepID=A0AAJ1MN50_9SPIO|nr:proline--tRNA ligase [Spirochaetales bacterium]
MRFSQIFGHTLKEAPSDAQAVSHQYLIRGGYIHQVAAGLFSYLPLARRVLNKIEGILHEEMAMIGAQEITMPVVLPADMWQDSGRWYTIGSEMTKFHDRKDHDMVLAMTHEEALCDLAAKYIRSHKELPQLVYHIQTKWRDDARPRAGLIRVREFKMKDSYSLDTSWEGLDKQYRAHYQSYFNIFNRCGLDVLAVKSDTGMMGGKIAHEFMYLTPIGEDTIIYCDSCGYNSNRQVAEFEKPEAVKEDLKDVEKIETPDCKTIDDLAKFLDVPESRTAKAVFMVATIQEDNETEVEKFVLAILRGDMDLNETKLANAVKAKDLRPAHEDEIKAVGAVPGYGSPVGVKGAYVVVDDLAAESTNLVGGANEAGFHLLNLNCGRDFKADLVIDIAAAEAGYKCVNCGAELKAEKAVEVGNIFKLGTRYSEAMNVTYQDENGKLQPVIMGSYGIGVGRLLSCVVEQHNDEYGIKWPISIAPFQVEIVLLHDKKGTEAQEVAESLYEDFKAAGIEVLFDDRKESPGFKFNDADLIGIPLRLTVGRRALDKGGVEFKVRGEKDNEIVPVDEAVDKIKTEIQRLEKELRDRVQKVEYKD